MPYRFIFLLKSNQIVLNHYVIERTDVMFYPKKTGSFAQEKDTILSQKSSFSVISDDLFTKYIVNQYGNMLRGYLRPSVLLKL